MSEYYIRESQYPKRYLQQVIDEDDADNYCNFNDIGVAIKVINTLLDSKSFCMKG